MQDHLGSTTSVTDETGATTQKTIYYPWGQAWATAGTVKDNRFASMDPRDSESGNDPTLFRMYQPRLYRWLSPDPLAGSILNPQSLNRYAYVGNNPVNFIDPLGLCGETMQVSSSINGGQPSTPATSYGPPCVGIRDFATGGGCAYIWSTGNMSDPHCQPGNPIQTVSVETPSELEPPLEPIIVSVNTCAANVSDSFSAASVLGVSDNVVGNFLLGSVTSSASRLVFSPNPDTYVPEGGNLAVGAHGAEVLNRGVNAAGQIRVNQGMQSVFTTVAPTRLAETVPHQIAARGSGVFARTLAKIGTPLLAYDAAVYFGALVACAQ